MRNSELCVRKLYLHDMLLHFYFWSLLELALGKKKKYSLFEVLSCFVYVFASYLKITPPKCNITENLTQ